MIMYKVSISNEFETFSNMPISGIQQAINHLNKVGSLHAPNFIDMSNLYTSLSNNGSAYVKTNNNRVIEITEVFIIKNPIKKFPKIEDLICKS